MSKDIKDLPPEERIKKLKELEKKRTKEIEEAQKEIKKSEEELTERRKWEDKVPIPEIAADVDSLEGEGKDLVKTLKGITDTEEVEEPEEKPVEEVSLEETVAQERIELPQAIMDSEYAIQMSQRPMQELYGEISAINERVEEKGYVSKEEERKVRYLSSAVEHKVQDVKAGKYSFTEETAHAASVTQQMGAKINNTYNAGDHKSSIHGRDWYSGK